MSRVRIVSACYVISLILMVACTSATDKNAGTQSTADDNWIGMDDFHMVMAESFHPFRDSANLAPAKVYAKELVIAAKDWSGQRRPARVDTDEVKELMNQLIAETENLSSLVEAATDDEIGESLTNLHDIFHQLQERWYKREAGDEH